MRFLSSRVCVIAAAAAVALSTSGVSGGTICYPGCGTNDYAGFSSTLTPFKKSISLPKFDAGADRVLTKVTIRTKAFFTTDFYMTCTDGVDAGNNNCGTTFGGTSSAGVIFGINPSSSTSATLRADLPQYWGRWGGFRHDIENSQYIAANRVGVSENGIDPFFVPYTYPFFDVPQFVPTNNGAGNAEDVWAYLNPGAGQTSNFYFASTPTTYSVDSKDGNVVRYGNNPPFDESYTAVLGVPGGTPKFLAYGPSSGGVATPFGDEVYIGTYTFDGTGTPYEKSISLNDFSKGGGGGETNEMTPAQMLALFSDETSSGEQIVWDTDADGFVTALVEGGNFGGRQVTTGYSQMQIEYEYTGDAITSGDPQFSGFQGQSFQIHGYPGSYFHLMSAPQFQMNGRFAYIANGHCNYNHTACWTHPGTYIDDLAIIVDELLVRITAGAVGQGYSVRINDEPFHAHTHGMNETSDHTDVREFVPTKFYDAATRLTVHLRSPLELYVRTDLFALTIHNADHFFNIDSQLLVRPILKMGHEASTKYPHPQNGKPWFPQFPIHGFIGQTWAKATYNNNKQYQGDVDDYVETRPYATESIYSQYFKKFDDKNMNWEN